MAKADRVHSTPPLNSSSIERANHRNPVRSPWIRFPINPVSDSPENPFLAIATVWMPVAPRDVLCARAASRTPAADAAVFA
jgi:hypothetical protein